MDSKEKLAAAVRARIREVADFPEPGIQFKDLTPVFADGVLHRAMTEWFAVRYRDQNVDLVVGVEARGFVVGAPLAAALGVGFVPVRKPGKLPGPCLTEAYTLEYGSNALQLSEGLLKPGQRVVVMDDVLATGGTLAATCKLVRQTGAEVTETGLVVELGFLSGRETLGSTPCTSLVCY